MTIFITGAGLIGSFTAKGLIAQGHRVILFDRNPSRSYLRTVYPRQFPSIETGDIRDAKLIHSLFLKYKPSVVIHSAAALRGILEADPLLGVSINTVGVAALVLAAAETPVGKIIFCSSLSVYDYSFRTNAAITEAHPLGPSGPYDATKVAGEYIANSLAHIQKIDLIILRLASVYGYGLFRGGAWLGRQLQILLNDAISDKSIVVNEKDFGSNEYVYVEDVADAIIQSCLLSIRSTVINIGSNEIVTSRSLARSISKVAHNKKIRFEAAARNYSLPNFLKRRYPFNLTKAKKLLGYTPKYSFEEGLLDYIRYFVPEKNMTRRF